MAVVHGRYISLPSSEDRRWRLERHLKELGISDRYRWFTAIRGKAEAAKTRDLGAGEWGLWQSWIKLLEEEITSEVKAYDWLHIVEDDVELSTSFPVFCQRLKREKPDYDLLFTDMYVNPSIYQSLAVQHQDLQAQGILSFKKDVYTGCTASVLIHQECMPQLVRCLKEEISNEGPLLPLDNQLRRLIHESKLHFARTAPFISSVQEDSISESTIQEPKKEAYSVVLTQMICTNLRRQLSMLDTRKSTYQLIELIEKLAQDKGEPTQIELRRSINEQIIRVAESSNLLRYKNHTRLIGEPDNPHQ